MDARARIVGRIAGEVVDDAGEVDIAPLVALTVLALKLPFMGTRSCRC